MKYTDEIVVDRATSLFWQKGYSSVGMRELQQALDMRPGSIYHRFNSKEGLFKRVIEHYVAISEAQLMDIANLEAPLTELRGYFIETLTKPEQMQYQRQCLLVKTIADIDNVNDDVQQAITKGMNALRNAFEQVLIKAQATEALSEHCDTKQQSVWLQCQFVGLRTFALLNNDTNLITMLVDKTMADLCRAD